MTPQPGEVTDLLWLSPQDAVARHTARGRRRLALALRAQEADTCFYLDETRTRPATPLT